MIRINHTLFGESISRLNDVKRFNLISQRIIKKLFATLLLSNLFLTSGCEYVYNGPGFPIIEENPNAEPWFNIYRPADMVAVIEETENLLPVIVWANGGCFRSDFPWQPLFKRWAAEGYVVLALSETPNGGALASTTVAHHGALINWILNEATYTDLIDSDRVIAAGNSCGGVTGLGLTAIDSRVAGVFVLSGSSAIGSTSKRIMEAIDVPVGYVIGASNDIAGGPARSDYQAMLEGVPAMIVSRAKGGHITVSTTTSILEEVADISFHWMDLVLYGNSDSYDELMSDDVCSDCTPGIWSMESKYLDTLLD